MNSLRILDAEVAHKIMGWRDIHLYKGQYYVGTTPEGDEIGIDFFTSSLDDAMRVMYEVCAQSPKWTFHVTLHGETVVATITFEDNDVLSKEGLPMGQWYTVASVEAESVPLAICQVALEALQTHWRPDKEALPQC